MRVRSPRERRERQLELQLGREDAVARRDVAVREALGGQRGRGGGQVRRQRRQVRARQWRRRCRRGRTRTLLRAHARQVLLVLLRRARRRQERLQVALSVLWNVS